MKRFIYLTLAILLMTTISASAQNTFSYKVGAYEIILLSEGQSQGNPGILIGATQQMVMETIPDGTFPNAINAFLIRTPDKNILVDTGLGRNLVQNLQAVGVSPDDIHTVIITHMHGDHIGGMLDGDNKVFKNATVQIGEVERNYWSSTEEMNKVAENKRGSFRAAQKMLNTYADKLEVVTLTDIEEKTGDGIFFIKAFGHTPGHTACLVQSGNDKLLIWADLTHAMAIQMPYPEVAVTYDWNPEMAVKSRQAILQYVAAHSIPIAGMHIAYPGIGKVKFADKGYVFTPAE